jgi:hypothetical protein
MFTQAMPALIDALRQALPSSSVGPIAQALGNCAQPLSHRAGVNFPGQRRANKNGAFGSGTWDPFQYQDLMPGGGTSNAANYHTNVDIGGMNVTWNEGNRYDSQFYFPTNQVFNQNQYFGGPTVHVTGGANIDYITNEYYDGDTINVTNVTTEVLNGDPIRGPAGPPGAAGRDGQRGAPGAPGIIFGAIPPGFFKEINYLSGNNPAVDSQQERVSKPHRYIRNAWIRGEVQVSVPTNSIAGGTVTITAKSTSFDVPTNAISGGTFTLSPAPVQVVVPTAVTFDPEACAVSFSSTTTVWAFPSEPSYQTLATSAATTQTITVASTAAVTAALSTTAASTIAVYAATTSVSQQASAFGVGGFVIKGTDQHFWAETPSVVVARDPKLNGVNQQNIKVYTPQ